MCGDTLTLLVYDCDRHQILFHLRDFKFLFFRTGHLPTQNRINVFVKLFCDARLNFGNVRVDYF